MKSLLNNWYIIPTTWFFLFLVCSLSIVFKREYLYISSALLLCLCALLQIVVLIYEWRRGRHFVIHLLFLAAYFVMAILLLLSEPYFYGCAVKPIDGQIVPDSTYSKIYCYDDSVKPVPNDTSSWIVLKEGEIGYYYFDYYHPQIDSSYITFLVFDTNNQSKPIYENQILTNNYHKEFGVLYRDSFTVFADNTSGNIISAIFRVGTHDADRKGVKTQQEKRYMLHLWRR
jgi:hypothetical protein